MQDKEIRIVWKEAVIDELNSSDRELIEAAKNATENSYSPYSGFKVGAAIRLTDNTIITGSNQENAAYPSGLCAERTALFAAGVTHPDKAVVSLAIAARQDNHFTTEPISPCGACRQVIAETVSRYNNKIRILLYGSNKTIIIENGSATLLPFCFNSDTLEAR